MTLWNYLVLTLSLCFVLSFSKGGLHAEPPPSKRIPFPEAQRKALSVVTGKMLSGSLEQEKTKWVYVFEVRGMSGRVHRVSLDAESGKILGDSIQKTRQPSRE